MTRIVAGSAKGRRLGVPPGGTRPTSERAREAVFSALTARWGSLDGARVLDLYAGSGALGLEAASRGAAHVELVEADRAAAVVLRRNADAVALPGLVVSAVPVERWVATSGRRLGESGQPFDLVFMDPPYAVSHDEVTSVLVSLAAAGLLREGGWVVVERASRSEPFAWPTGFSAEQDRRYGEAQMWFGRFGSVAAC